MDGIQLALAVAGGISVIGGAAMYIHKAAKPFFELRRRVERVEAHEKRDLERFDKLERSIEDMLKRSDEADQGLYLCVLAMIDHMIDGNSVDNMKKARKELREHIIKN